MTLADEDVNSRLVVNADVDVLLQKFLNNL